MNLNLYRHQLTIISLAIFVMVAGYCVILRSTDAILLDYDIVSSVSGLSENPETLSQKRDNLRDRLSQRQALLEETRQRKTFTQDVFRNLAEVYKSQLTQLETSNAAGSERPRYAVTYSGTIGNLLQLLNAFETAYRVRIEQVLLHPDNDNGSQIRMSLAVSAQ